MEAIGRETTNAEAKEGKRRQCPNRAPAQASDAMRLDIHHLAPDIQGAAQRPVSEDREGKRSPSPVGGSCRRCQARGGGISQVGSSARRGAGV
jgi:hypothetical protein